MHFPLNIFEHICLSINWSISILNEIYAANQSFEALASVECVEQLL